MSTFRKTTWAPNKWQWSEHLPGRGSQIERKVVGSELPETLFGCGPVFTEVKKVSKLRSAKVGCRQTHHLSERLHRQSRCCHVLRRPSVKSWQVPLAAPLTPVHLFGCEVRIWDACCSAAVSQKTKRLLTQHHPKSPSCALGPAFLCLLKMKVLPRIWQAGVIMYPVTFRGENGRIYCCCGFFSTCWKISSKHSI